MFCEPWPDSLSLSVCDSSMWRIVKWKQQTVCIEISNHSNIKRSWSAKCPWSVCMIFVIFASLLLPSGWFFYLLGFFYLADICLVVFCLYFLIYLFCRYLYFPDLLTHSCRQWNACYLWHIQTGDEVFFWMSIYDIMMEIFSLAWPLAVLKVCSYLPWNVFFEGYSYVGVLPCSVEGPNIITA